MTLRPVLDRIIVTPLAAETRTAGGIELPNAKRPRRGTIVAVGPGRWNRDGSCRLPLAFEVGQVVEWGVDGGQRLKVQGQEYVVLGEPEVLAVLA